jgi:hypothetical protein
MNRRTLFVLLLLVLAATMPVVVLGQSGTSQPVDFGMRIVSPQPVSEVHGTVDIIGTANVANQVYYYLEFTHLADGELVPSDNDTWIPFTEARTTPVSNGVLAEADTTQVPDGVYALRLTVNVSDNETTGNSFHTILTPVRISNGANPNPDPVPLPTPNPEDRTPRVTTADGILAANVRHCDIVDNDRCPTVANLNAGQEAPVLAISANNTGWFQVRTPAGSTGWVSPTVVQQLGDFSGLPRVAPPTPLPPPPPPGNVIPNGISFQGGNPQCLIPQTILINMGNVGGTTSQPGTVTVQNIALRTGDVTFTGFGSFPQLAPGQNWAVAIPATFTTFYNEQHELRASANGHTITMRYTLGQGNCP